MGENARTAARYVGPNQHGLRHGAEGFYIVDPPEAQEAGTVRFYQHGRSTFSRVPMANLSAPAVEEPETHDDPAGRHHRFTIEAGETGTGEEVRPEWSAKAPNGASLELYTEPNGGRVLMVNAEYGYGQGMEPEGFDALARAWLVGADPLLPVRMGDGEKLRSVLRTLDADTLRDMWHELRRAIEAVEEVGKEKV